MKQRRGIRRIIIWAGTFLLLGAVVNIAVAWACTANMPTKFRYSRLPALTPSEVQRIEDRGRKPAVPEVNLQSKGMGWKLRYNRLQPPRWLEEVRKSFELGGVDMCVYEVQSGWPCHALRGELWQLLEDKPESTKTSFEFVSAFRAPLGKSGAITPRRVLGLNPLLLGFAINTLFYAAILCLLFAAPFALRRWRRVKRGVCPACAYPVGTSDVCTECGKPVS